MADILIEWGREFHNRGAAAVKALSPQLLFVLNCVKFVELEERRPARELKEILRREEIYSGTDPFSER